MTKRYLGLDYLRGFLVAWVVAFHAITAYINFGRAALGFPYVFDTHTWVGFLLFFLFSDSFFMALMFFISGLFVWSALARKGAWSFLRARALRLGGPLVLGVLLVMPPAH